ncbi:hypothetical protein HK103_003151 [Boothiomyces macroporosus]|uniref:Uncharacterized protein n=1 Tax=Boothiomyces macroporosus TaxID=261099 RepID=A0AAD5UCK6_9FUNG|nr:hypothetical protein HK103_003151 [Boothiomyces macroporosus]
MSSNLQLAIKTNLTILETFSPALFSNVSDSKEWEKTILNLLLFLDANIHSKFALCYPTTSKTIKEFKSAVFQYCSGFMHFRKSDLDYYRGERFELFILNLSNIIMKKKYQELLKEKQQDNIQVSDLSPLKIPIETRALILKDSINYQYKILQENLDLSHLQQAKLQAFETRLKHEIEATKMRLEGFNKTELENQVKEKMQEKRELHERNLFWKSFIEFVDKL